MKPSSAGQSIAAAIGLFSMWAAAAADASGIDQLRAFLTTAKSGKASFTQTVSSKSARVGRESTGSFAFARPGKFRWAYQQPFEQLIVGDGEKLWIHDHDLNQVIVRKLDRALGTSPAAILAGDNALERNFTLTDGGVGEGLEYVNAFPRTADTGFERVRIGFKDNLPRVMELADSFGNTTLLQFRGFERNVELDAGAFRFTVPPGADVVGE
jgi:outer membrane lipoprotein carrier protein